MAVLVAHGMGQQVQFETLEQVAIALRAQDPGPDRDRPILVRRSAPGDGPGSQSQRLEDLPRAEVVLAGRTVHLYEMYWAPLTEGKVGLWATFSFLVRAGVMGILNSRGGLSFRRFLFNRWQTFGYPFSSLVALVLAVALLSGLLLVNLTIAAVVVPRLIAGTAGTLLDADSIQNLTKIFALFVLAMGVLGAGVVTASRIRKHTRQGSAARTFGVVLGWICVWTAVPMLSVLWLAVLLQWFHRDWGMSWIEAVATPVLSLLGRNDTVPIWTAVVLINVALRYFVVQYVGDVAAYVSTHTVSAFHSVRQDIQRASQRVARLVYAARGPDGDRLYDRVIVIGHSLGSLIAYDTVNAMIREDLLGGGLAVRDRTQHLFTYGSPLDKTAFIFRTQRPHEAPVREALAGSVQPMITSMNLRPRHWTNIHSPADWISGDITYYGPAEKAAEFRGLPGWIENVNDPGVCTPLLAHNEYWSGVLPRRLYGAVTGND